MKLLAKTYRELTKDELYTILQLRSEIFVVEQDCVYQDIDGKDKKALHVLGLVNNIIVAYTRCFKPGDYFKEASFGRVLVREDHRNKGLAHKIIERSIHIIKDQFNCNEIMVSAQTYLKSFYEAHGFMKTGQEYLEDGIPHIAMVLEDN